MCFFNRSHSPTARQQLHTTLIVRRFIMGSSHSAFEFSVNELKNTLRRDNLLYQADVVESLLFNDDFVAKKYLQELESCTTKYKEEDEQLKQKLKNYEKGINVLLALSVMQDSTEFKHKEVRWLKKEIHRVAQGHQNAFEAILEKRMQLLEQLYMALVRYDHRLKVFYSTCIKPPPHQNKNRHACCLFPGFLFRFLNLLLFSIARGFLLLLRHQQSITLPHRPQVP